MAARCRIVIVHGTFAFDEFDDVPPTITDPTEDIENRWPKSWQNGSKFAEQIVTGLAPTKVTAPVKQMYSVLADLRPHWNRWFGRLAHNVPTADKRDTRVFHWSGENSESARREASERLLIHLHQVNQECESDESEFHVIAHSHAGNVVLDALTLASRDSTKLKRLGRWITVGTPYLRFRWDVSVFLATLLLLVLLSLSLFLPLPGVGPSLFPWQWLGLTGKPWDWFSDYWSRFDAVSAYSAGVNFTLAVMLSSTSIILLCLLGRALWETYCYWNSHMVIPGDRRRIEFSDMVWGWTSFFTVLVIAGLSCFICWLALGKASISHFLITGCLIVSSWRGAAGLAATSIIAVAFFVPFSLLIVSTFRAFDENRRIRDRKAAWKIFGNKAFLIAAANDEPIAGLKAVQHKPTGPLLPRITAPRVNRYGKLTKRVRYPERERLGDRWLRRLFDLFFLPITLFRDWVLRPLYNDVFAALLDSFVLGRLWKKAHGCDIFGLVPDKVLTTPMSEGEIDGTPPIVFRPPDVEALTEEPLLRAVRGIRRALGRDYPVGVYLADFFKRAMQGKEVEEQALIHTSYFANGSVETKNAIIQAFKGVNNEMPQLPTEQEAGPPVDSRQANPGMYEFLMWLFRNFTIMLIFSLPWFLVVLLTFAVFYQHSAWFYQTKLRMDKAVVQKNLFSFCWNQAISEDMTFGYYVLLANNRGLAEDPLILIRDAALKPDDSIRGLQRLELVARSMGDTTVAERAKGMAKVYEKQVEKLGGPDKLFSTQLPALPRASISDLGEFTSHWSEEDVKNALKPGAPWRNLRFDLMDGVELGLSEFRGHEERLASIDGWLSKRSPDGGSDINVQLVIELLTQHASIFWRTTTQRENALGYLKNAEDLLQKQHALSASVYQNALLLLSIARARVGDYEQAFSLSERLDGTLRLRFAVAVMFAELNRPWNNERDSRFSFCLESAPLKKAIKDLPAP